METNKGKNLILILLFVLLLINISMMVTFFLFPRNENTEPDQNKKYKYKEKHQCFMRELQLDENQETEFFKLRDEHKNTIEKMFQEVKSTRNKMIDAIAAETELSADNLYLYADSIGQIESQIHRETIDYFMKMKLLLNPQQFGKLVDNFREVCGCHMSHQKHKHKDKKTKRYIHKDE